MTGVRQCYVFSEEYIRPLKKFYDKSNTRYYDCCYKCTECKWMYVG